MTSAVVAPGVFLWGVGAFVRRGYGELPLRLRPLKGQRRQSKHAAEFCFSMPSDVLDAHPRFARQGGAKRFSVQASQRRDRLIAPGELLRYEDSPVIGQAPRACVEQLVEGWFEGDAIGYVIGTVIGMPS